MNNDDLQLVIPNQEQPSTLRRLFRRTLYLRLLEGEFVLWCFETGRTARQATDLLSHPRVVVSDFQALSAYLTKSIDEVSGRRFFILRTVLIVHCLRKLEGGITPAENITLYETCKRLGVNEFFVISKDRQIHQMSDREIVTLCHELGGFVRHMRKPNAAFPVSK